MNSRRLTELAVLTSIALILFIVELQIPSPIPIPGVKLGLANIVTVCALYRYRPGEAALVLFARILLGALLSGNTFALLFSLTGGLCCFTGMLGLRRLIPGERLWISSVLGAVLHNLGQIAVAILVSGTTAIVLYLPLLLVSGCVAGLFTGLCAQELLKRLPRRDVPPKDRAGCASASRDGES